MSGRRAIETLAQRLAERANELQQVLATNAALRMRGAAIDVLTRVQEDVMQICARLGLGPAAPFAGFSHEQPHGSSAAATSPVHVDSSAASSGDVSKGKGNGRVQLLAPDIHGWLLQQLPWLARGLDMADVSHADVQTFQQMDISTARTAWRDLVVSLLQFSGPPDEAVAAARRICQFWTSMVVFNPLLYMEFQSTQLLTGQPATGGEDAPLQHWETVIRSTKLTKLQAMVVVELQKFCSEQLKRISGERSALLEVIAAETAAAASTTAARSAAVEVSEAPWSALMDDLQGTVQKQQTMLMMVSLSFRAVMTTEQFGRMMALAFPYPCNANKICNVLAHFIRLEPEAFQSAPSLP